CSAPSIARVTVRFCAGFRLLRGRTSSTYCTKDAGGRDRRRYKFLLSSDCARPVPASYAEGQPHHKERSYHWEATRFRDGKGRCDEIKVYIVTDPRYGDRVSSDNLAEIVDSQGDLGNVGTRELDLGKASVTVKEFDITKAINAVSFAD